MAEGGGPDPQPLARPVGLATRAGSRPVHLPWQQERGSHPRVQLGRPPLSKRAPCYSAILLRRDLVRPERFELSTFPV